MLFNQMIYRLNSLGENPYNIAAYEQMIRTLQDLFTQFKTKEETLDFLKNNGTYIPPIEVS